MAFKKVAIYGRAVLYYIPKLQNNASESAGVAIRIMVLRFVERANDWTRRPRDIDRENKLGAHLGSNLSARACMCMSSGTGSTTATGGCGSADGMDQSWIQQMENRVHTLPGDASPYTPARPCNRPSRTCRSSRDASGRAESPRRSSRGPSLAG
jgi:hypothetical protein